MIILWAAGLTLIFTCLYRKNDRVPTGLTNMLEAVVVFIRDEISIGCLGQEDGRKMAPLFCTFFFFILGLNILGLVPLFATATANVNVTAALAVITFLFMVFGAIYKNGFMGFLKCFVPSGVPTPILFLIVPVEFFGLFIKTAALAIRLFANMLGGHIVVVALLGLVGVFGVVALPSIFLALFISLLEVLVVFLQTYIFTLLSALFIGQMYHPEH